MTPHRTHTRPIPLPRRLFSIDLQTLAFFRIALGLLILADLVCRTRDLAAHYSDRGVMPRRALLEDMVEAGHWSLHLVSGSAAVQGLLFLAAALLAACLVAGYRTRVAAVGSWLMLVSLHARNPLVLQGGDSVLRLLLFWAMFLPLGARLSLDARQRHKAPGGARTHGDAADPAAVCTPATAALLLQVLMIYAFSVALKSYTVWLESGTAGYYALMIDPFVTPAGKKLLAYPELLSALTRAAYLLEAGCVAAALSPVGTRHIRRVLVPVMMCLHLGFGLCMELGLFSLVMCAAWIPFLPGRNRPAAVSGPPTAVPAGTGTRAARTAAGTVVLLCLAYVYLWNLRTTDFDRYEKMFPRAWNAPARLLGLSQHWKLFAPHPSREDGWLVIPATLVDGSKVDLFRGGRPVDWNKPETVSALYPNQRWRKYLMNLQKERHRRHCQTYAQHLTRQWNDAQPAGRQLVRFSIVLVRERTLGGGRTAPPEYDELWRHFGPAYAP